MPGISVSRIGIPFGKSLSGTVPENIMLTEITGGIRITWDASATAETEIYVSVNQGTYFLEATIAPNIGAYDYVCDIGAEFDFKLRFKIDETVLNAPINLVSQIVAGFIRLTWDDNNTEAEYIEIYGDTGSGYSLITTLAVGVETYDHYLEGGNTITYKIRAKEGTLPVYSAYSDETASLVFPITDGDGNTYETIEIGGLTIASTLLITTKYLDGSAIDYPLAAGWAVNTNGSYGWADWNVGLKNYGGLYDRYAYENVKKIVPTGYHIATVANWATLSAALGGDAASGGEMKVSGTTYWASPNTGNHTSGMNLRGAGYINESNGVSNTKRYFLMMSGTGGNQFYLQESNATLNYTGGISAKRGLAILFVKD